MRKPLALLQHITADENRHKTSLTDTEFCMLPRMASSMFEMAVKRFRENLLIVSSTILYLEFRLRASTRIGQQNGAAMLSIGLQGRIDVWTNTAGRRIGDQAAG
jgi:hypothetical protein